MAVEHGYGLFFFGHTVLSPVGTLLEDGSAARSFYCQFWLKEPGFITQTFWFFLPIDQEQ